MKYVFKTDKKLRAEQARLKETYDKIPEEDEATRKNLDKQINEIGDFIDKRNAVIFVAVSAAGLIGISLLGTVVNDSINQHILKDRTGHITRYYWTKRRVSEDEARYILNRYFNDGIKIKKTLKELGII